jgi:ureidoacrylate peracid hydrolase
MNKLNPEKTALLIVDIQTDFCSPNGLSAKKGRGLTNIQSILPQLRNFQQNVKKLGVLTIFTKFIHRSEQNTPTNLNMLIKESNLSPVCKEGTKGADLYYLTPSPDDLIIDKQYYDCFAGTKLLKILKKNKIEIVLITGVRTDICIDTTGKRAFSEGFNTFIISDLVATTDQRKEIHDILLATFNKYYGFVINSETVLKLLKKRD